MRQTTLSKEERRLIARRQAVKRIQRQERMRGLLPWFGVGIVLVLVIAVVMWMQIRPTILGK